MPCVEESKKRFRNDGAAQMEEGLRGANGRRASEMEQGRPTGKDDRANRHAKVVGGGGERADARKAALAALAARSMKAQQGGDAAIAGEEEAQQRNAPKVARAGSATATAGAPKEQNLNPGQAGEGGGVAGKKRRLMRSAAQDTDSVAAKGKENAKEGVQEELGDMLEDF